MDGARVVRFFENGVHLIRHTPLPTANWPPYALLLLNDASSVNSVATLLSIRTNTTFGSIQTSSFIAAPWVVKEYRGLVSHVVKLRFVNQLNFHLSDPVTDRPSTRFPGPLGPYSVNRAIVWLCLPSSILLLPGHLPIPIEQFNRWISWAGAMWKISNDQ